MTLTLDRVGRGAPDTGLLAGMISTGVFLNRAGLIRQDTIEGEKEHLACILNIA